MNSFILSSLFFLVNFMIKIKADDTKIETDIKCNGDNYLYYNSIEHECKSCNVKVYNNICYSSRKSVYGYGNLTLEKICSDDEIMTELDDEGKHLGVLTCAATKQALLPNSTTYESSTLTFDFNSFLNIRKPEEGHSQNSFGLREFDQDVISYSIDACQKGLYAKSCQYLANLCVLSMYKEENDFCKITFDSQTIK